MTGELRNQGGKRRRAKAAAKAGPANLHLAQGNADDASTFLHAVFKRMTSRTLPTAITT